VWRERLETLRAARPRVRLASAGASGALVAAVMGLVGSGPGAPAPRVPGFVGRGAMESPVFFEARGDGFALLLSDVEARVVPSCPSGPCRSIGLRFAGRGGGMRLVPERPLRSPRAFGSILFADLYPGIAVRFAQRAGQMRWTFFIDRGAGPQSVRLELDGVDTLQLDGAGALVARAAGVSLVLPPLEARQATPAGPQVIPARYALRGPRAVALDVDAYDVRRPLVIRSAGVLRVERPAR
jgi:hypothetical protein